MLVLGLIAGSFMIGFFSGTHFGVYAMKSYALKLIEALEHDLKK